MINEKSKLRTFIKFKTNYSMEKYINISDIPLCWRKLYCAFRISCHNLEIERGRYTRPRKPPEERMCKLCMSNAETECHFFIYCAHYSKLRDIMYEGVYSADKEFLNLGHEQKFQYLMTSKNDLIVKQVMKFIYCALGLRKEKLSEI